MGPQDASAPFSLNPVSGISFAPGGVREVAEHATNFGDTGKPVVLVVDGGLLELGVAEPVISSLQQSGAEVHVFSEIQGEPKQYQVEAATETARSCNAGMVVCMGGGSAMDIGKIAATIARSEHGPADFAMQGMDLPNDRVPKICIPTTAGTGSELSSTNIFTNTDGKKVWVWGVETKPEHVILDPELTLSLPSNLTAWTGLDAFSHAFESCTNINRHHGNKFYAHKALSLISASLETAVKEPGNIDARSNLMLGSAYAGIALDNCSAAMAHNISHALACLSPVHHGFATGLAIEVILAWQVEEDEGQFADAAEACGLERDVNALVGWYSDLLNRCAIERKLPESFKSFSDLDLANAMQLPETTPMADVTARKVTPVDINRFAATVMAMA